MLELISDHESRDKKALRALLLFDHESSDDAQRETTNRQMTRYKRSGQLCLISFIFSVI